MEATVKVQKLGNSLGISIPSAIANGMSLREGLYVNLQESGNRIIIEARKPNVSYNLNDLLNEITENNIHQSIDTGTPVGNEIW